MDIQQLLNSNRKTVLAITGGGAEAIGELLRHGNGSKLLVEAVVPYDNASFKAFIGTLPEKFCSPEAAVALAMAAFQRLDNLAIPVPIEQWVGLGATSSLVKPDGERDGRLHQIYVSTQTDRTTSVHAATFGNSLSREEEEHFSSELILNCLGFACGVCESPDASQWGGKTPTKLRTKTIIRQAPSENIFRLFTRNTNATSYILNHDYALERPKVLFPGSFNPPHASHLKIAEAAAKIIGSPVDFEISITNVDKIPLSYCAITDRIEWLSAMTTGNPAFGQVYFTRAPKFIDKSRLFPDATFVVGYDTLRRIDDPQYYRDNEEFVKNMEELHRAKNRFLVFHRSDIELAPIHHHLRKLCQFVPGEIFTDEAKLSSTQLRKEMDFWKENDEQPS